MIQSPKSSNLNFYIRQGLGRLVLQPKFLFDQGRAAVALDMEIGFIDREMSLKTQVSKITTIGIPCRLS